MEVHPLERELLSRIRTKFRFGEVRIETRDGLPYRIAEVVSYEKLSEPVVHIVEIDVDRPSGL